MVDQGCDPPDPGLDDLPVTIGSGANYDPEVMNHFPELFNHIWRNYWGIGSVVRGAIAAWP